MKQQYTYSMPESFLKDKSVPARWRVLAVINGFILNGGCFYGSNAWMMEQLDCSEQTVSNAFEELEAVGQVRIDRTRRTRRVYIAETQVGLGLRPKPVGVSDPSWFGTNSVSNSVKNTEQSSEIVIVKDEEEKPQKTDKRVKEKESVFLLFGGRQAWWLSASQRTAALALLDNYGYDQVAKAVALVKESQDDPFAPKATTPSQLVQKWGALLNYKNKKL